MSQPTLSRKLALRIGLAAKALPDTEPKFLLERLIEHCRLPLTEEKLAAINIEQYQTVIRGGFTKRDIQCSLGYLHGEDLRITKQAKPKLYRPGDMPNSIRLAIASNNGQQINAGFSNCKQFYIYQVSSQEDRLIAIRVADSNKAKKSEEKQAYRAEIIADCQVLYSSSIGVRAAAKLVKKGVHPITVNQTAYIPEIIEQLQYVLTTSPPPWLAKRMGIEPTTTYHFSGEKIS